MSRVREPWFAVSVVKKPPDDAPVSDRLRYLAEYQRIRQIAYDAGSAADVLIEAANALDEAASSQPNPASRATEREDAK